MNTTDKIVTALTPGSIFNGNGLVFRSLGALAEFTGLAEDEVLELLNGDMSQVVTCKPSKKGKGILVALVEQVQIQQAVAEAEAGEPTVIAAMPADPEEPIVETEIIDEEPVHEAPLGDAPTVDDAEEVVA